MKVLVIGSGGREHALCWRLAACSSVKEVFCAPGNPGTAQTGVNVPIGVTEYDKLIAFAQQEEIALTVVGPEVPLCEGIVDRFTDVGLVVAGPTQAAARLEGSKIFAKRFMDRHGIATAPFFCCKDLPAVRRALTENPKALVTKADGLAAGKGVVVADSPEEVVEVAARIFEQGASTLLLEERLWGEEVSVIALSDGERVVVLASSQDHKAALDGDRGPNTGGMGAYSPAPVLTPELSLRVRDEVIMPTVRGMAADGVPYRGVLYAGLMIVEGEPIVLEYNCRFGDPETQVLLPRLRGDFGQLLLGVAQGALPSEEPQWDPRSAVCVVLAAAGYPGPYEKGAEIVIPEALQSKNDGVVFHAGTAAEGGTLRSSGGRVLGVTALGTDLAEARGAAYATVSEIAWPGAHYRRDIGARGLVGG